MKIIADLINLDEDPPPGKKPLNPAHTESGDIEVVIAAHPPPAQIARLPDPKAKMKIELENPPSNEKPEVTVKSMHKAAHRGQAECEGQQQVQGRPPAHRAQAQYAAKVA
jgi:hypothetical protein